MILRGSDVEHHNVVNDMMQTEHITYRPQYGVDGFLKDSNVCSNNLIILCLLTVVVRTKIF